MQRNDEIIKYYLLCFKIVSWERNRRRFEDLYFW